MPEGSCSEASVVRSWRCLPMVVTSSTTRLTDCIFARWAPLRLARFRDLRLSHESVFLARWRIGLGYYENGQLKRISISGGATVVICRGHESFGANWATDNTILFGQPKGIMRVSANGGTPELVIPANEGEQVDGPQLLPDGDSVLFSVTTDSRNPVGRGPDCRPVAVQQARKVMLQGGSDARYLPTGHLVMPCVTPCWRSRLMSVGWK